MGHKDLKQQGLAGKVPKYVSYKFKNYTNFNSQQIKNFVKHFVMFDSWMSRIIPVYVVLVGVDVGVVKEPVVTKYSFQ